MSDRSEEFEIDPGDPLVVGHTDRAEDGVVTDGGPAAVDRVSVGPRPPSPGDDVDLAVVTSASDGARDADGPTETVALASAPGAGETVPAVEGGFERSVGDVTVAVPEGGTSGEGEDPHLPVVLIEGEEGCVAFVERETRTSRVRVREPQGRVAREVLEERGWDPTEPDVSLHGPGAATVGKRPSLVDQLDPDGDDRDDDGLHLG